MVTFATRKFKCDLAFNVNLLKSVWGVASLSWRELKFATQCDLCSLAKFVGINRLHFDQSVLSVSESSWVWFFASWDKLTSISSKIESLRRRVWLMAKESVSLGYIPHPLLVGIVTLSRISSEPSLYSSATLILVPKRSQSCPVINSKRDIIIVVRKFF